MGVWLETAVQSIFWAFALMALIAVLGLITTVNFSEAIFTPFGILVCYFLAFTCVYSIKMGKSKPG